MEGDRQAFGLVMVHWVGVGSDSSVGGRKTVPERARDKDRVGTARQPAACEKISHGMRGSAVPAVREDMRQPLLEAEGEVWRGAFVRVCFGAGVAVIVRVIFRVV